MVMLLRIYERMLVPHVAEYFRRKGYLVFGEQHAGLGRADLIAVTLDMRVVEERLEHRVPRIPIRTLLRIMRLLERKGELHIEELSTKLGYSPHYIKKIVSYVNPLYLSRQNGVVRKIRDYEPFVREMIAIEVKVGDWRSGLIQADTYLLATNKAYLAIYNGNFHRIPDEVLEWAKQRGIGILTVGKNGRVEEKLAAMNAGPKSMPAYYVVAESLWEKILRTSIHFSR